MPPRNPTPRTSPPRRASSAAPPQSGGRARKWTTAIALALVTVLVFSGSFSNGFVGWDDPAYVKNPLVQHPTPASALRLLTTVVSVNYHPLTMLSLWANAAVFGSRSATPFIVTNVLLHAGATVLLFFFVFRLARGRWLPATVTALLFGVHPMHVESVAWISERKDVLYAVLFLGACIAALRYLDEDDRRWLVAAFALFVLSCLAKGMAVVFPLVLVLLAYWRSDRARGVGSTLRRVPTAWWVALGATALLFGLIALNLQGGGDCFGLLTLLERQHAISGQMAPFRRIEIAAYGFCMYLIKLALPLHLSAFYPGPTAADLDGARRFVFLGTVAGAVAILAVAGWAYRRNRTLLFGIAFYTLTVALVLQVVPVGQAIMADRYSYLSSIGPFFAAGMGADAVRRPRALGQAVVGAVAAFAVMCCLLTRRQVQTWRDSEALWTPVIRLYPAAGLPYRLRGIYYGTVGRFDEAIRDLERSIVLDPRKADAYNGLGVAYGAKGDAARALAMFDEAIALDATKTDYYFNRGIAHLDTNLGAAIEDFDAAIRLDPAGDPRTRSARGYAHLRHGDWRLALQDFDVVIASGAATERDVTYRSLARRQLGDPSSPSGGSP